MFTALRRVSRVLLALCLGSTLLASARYAAAASTLEKTREQGYIRVGFANEAPFGYATADGTLTGESPEVVKAVAARIGIPRVDGVLTEFGSLIPGLKAGRFDIIAAGMFVNPRRCAQVQFSDPTYGIGQALLVEKGNPKRIVDYGTIADRSDLRLAVVAGAIETHYAKAAGVSRDQLLILPDQASLAKAVQTGRADAAGLTSPSISNIASKNDGVESTAPFSTVAGESVVGYGAVAFRKEDQRLYEAFNAELRKFIGTPAHIVLVKPFGFGEDTLPDKSTAELCADN